MKKKMKKPILAFGVFLSMYTSNAQPLHQPIPLYTNDGVYARTGHSSYFTTTPIGGLMEGTLGGIADDGATHYLAQNAYEPGGTYTGIVLEKKHATNGSSLGITTYNIGLAQGSTESQDRCNGIVLDNTLNRIYVYGFTNYTAALGQYHAFVICFDKTTLAPVASFGTGGMALIELNVGTYGTTGFALTGSGNNFLVTINKGGAILVKEYTSSLALVRTGNINATGYTYEATRGNMKKSPNNHYFIVGSSTNSSSQKVPMVWDIALNNLSTAYILYSSSSPSSLSLGQGYFVDFDFYVNPANTSLPGYLFDLITIGNNLAENGIYAKYLIKTATSYVPQVSFTNQPGSILPGIASPSNIPVVPIKFTRCTMASNGYTTVLGYFYSNTSDRLLMGYITPSGNQYTTTYQAQVPTPNSWMRIHKAAGLTKDLSGNILVSGCSMGSSYTTIKLSNTYDCTPVFNLKGSSSTICSGNAAILNANISTPGCTMTWKTLSPSVSTIYSGIPVSLLHYPSTTTVYECTVTNTATGCTNVRTILVNVIACVEDPTELTDNSHSPVMIDSTTNTDPAFMLPQSSLWPNPNNGEFTLTTNGSFTGDFIIYNSTGKQVRNFTRTSNNEQKFTLTDLNPGIYIIQYSINGIIENKRFCVTKQ